MLKLTPRNAYRLFRRQKGIRGDGWKFRDLKGHHKASGLSLDNCAKLFYSEYYSAYIVSGYHYAGEDVKEHAAYGELIAS